MIAVCLILAVYSGIILLLAYGFSKVKPFVFNPEKPKTSFSVVVPFRNEAENLPTLLDSFSKLDYPKELFEVILVDDDSDDGYGAQDAGYRVIKNVRRSQSPKKDAIVSAIAVAKHEWVITTDADCIVPEKWLSVLDAFIQQNQVDMVCGAVAYNDAHAFSGHFQQTDLAALQGVTIGSFGFGKPFMCNGANFAYTKKIFHDLNGFDGNQSHAGGDDVFLLQKAARQHPEKVGYLKSQLHIVATKPETTFRGLFYQRVRWASKIGSYQSSFGKWLGVMAFLGNAAWIFALAWLVSDTDKIVILFFLLLKWLADWILIRKTNALLMKPTRYYLLSAMAYPFFSTAVAVYSVFWKYEWKGRRF